MTPKVKCLTEPEKDHIVQLHAQRVFQKEIAKMYNVSERTINRVLNERGVATAVPRLQGEAYRVMRLLNRLGITPERLERILEGQPANV